MTTDYRIVWDIDLEADSPVEAAREALHIQRDPASLATVFEVIGPDGARHHIDLDALDTEEAESPAQDSPRQPRDTADSPTIVQVEYWVPVMAFVNLTTRTIERVVIAQEDVRLAPEAEARTAHGEPLADDALRTQAIGLAERSPWPAWEFGL